MKKWMRLIALAAVAFVVGSSPALATIVTDTFIGTVVTDDGNLGDVTTKDVNKDFTSSATTNLVGKSFTLTFTVDTSQFYIYQPDFNINGGTYYGFGGNPITGVLKIDNYTKTQTINDSSDAGIYSGPGGSITFQTFVYNAGTQLQGKSINVDLESVVNSSLGISLLLPQMLSSNGDFVDFYAFFNDPAGSGEKVVLNVTAVNPVPIPPSVLLLGTGLLGIAGLGWRRKKSQ